MSIVAIGAQSEHYPAFIFVCLAGLNTNAYPGSFLSALKLACGGAYLLDKEITSGFNMGTFPRRAAPDPNAAFSQPQASATFYADFESNPAASRLTIRHPALLRHSV